MNVPRGVNEDRLKPSQNNPREVAFVEQWEKEAKWHDLLDLLMRVPCERNEPGANLSVMGPYFRYPIGEPTERDRIVAATIIQWFGSNIGMDFIGQAFERFGYEYPRRKSPTKPAKESS